MFELRSGMVWCRQVIRDDFRLVLGSSTQWHGCFRSSLLRHLFWLTATKDLNECDFEYEYDFLVHLNS